MTMSPKPLDPFHACDRVRPDAAGLSLFAEPGDGPCWLYAPDALDLWLFNRLRHESFHACLSVYHPGLFRSVNPVLYASRQWSLETLPDTCRVRIAACGNLHVIFNGVTLLHQTATPAPEPVEMDLRPHLIAGNNWFRVRVHSLVGPPTVLVDGERVCTDAAWTVCADDQNFEPAQLCAFVGLDRFPHQERLPEAEIPAVRRGDGLWDFGAEAYGRPEVRVTGRGTLRFHPGESAPEAQNTDPIHREQLVADVAAETGTVQSPVELALRYLWVETSPGLTVGEVSLRASTYPVRYRGAFESSDPLLNRIWECAAHTLRLCMREVFLDGIKRDRLPWVGDLYLAGLANAHVFFDAGIMRRSLVTLSGAEPERVDFSGILDYSFFWILALHDYVLHFGDRAFLGRMRARLERLLAALEAKRDGTDLIPTDRCHRLFIDWAEVDKNGYSACLEFLAIRALDASSQMFTGSAMRKPRPPGGRRRSVAAPPRARASGWTAREPSATAPARSAWAAMPISWPCWPGWRLPRNARACSGAFCSTRRCRRSARPTCAAWRRKRWLGAAGGSRCSTDCAAIGAACSPPAPPVSGNATTRRSAATPITPCTAGRMPPVSVMPGAPVRFSCLAVICSAAGRSNRGGRDLSWNRGR